MILLILLLSPGLNFGSCDRCHTTESWYQLKSVEEFSHEETGFPLRAAHEVLKCGDCHKGKPLKGQGCTHCHEDFHQGKLGVRCEECHRSQSWQVPAFLSRHRQSRLPLLGGHALLACADCHKQRGDFRAVSIRCAGCHEPPRHPNHSALPSHCEDCHTAYGWSPARVAHDRYWPLSGPHRDVACVGCHPNDRYSGTPKHCASCHKLERSRGHLRGEKCEGCHRASSWSTVRPRRHPFPLKHGGSSCRGCHPKGRGSLSCNRCHPRSEMFRAHRPQRSYSGATRACLRCHPRGRR